MGQARLIAAVRKHASRRKGNSRGARRVGPTTSSVRRVGRPAGSRKLSRTVHEGKSTFKGRPIRVTRERGRYFGARWYFVIAYMLPTRQIQEIRYTPFERRAKILYRRMRRDIVDAERLRPSK